MLIDGLIVFSIFVAVAFFIVIGLLELQIRAHQRGDFNSKFAMKETRKFETYWDNHPEELERIRNIEHLSNLSADDQPKNGDQI